MKSLRDDLVAYWDRRAPSYTDVVLKNMDGGWDGIWADMLISRFPAGAPETLRVLDVGTGPGFYAIILAQRGYRVTAVDYSEKMLEQARQNAGPLAEKICFRQMDAQALEFPDGGFDAVVSRNLTWNLTDPVRAYREWRRVLRPGGVMLVFDANWYAYLNDDEKRRAWDLDRENTRAAGVEDHDSYADSRTMETLSLSLPMTPRQRPQWDLVTLLDLGFPVVSADLTVWDRVWSGEEKINSASPPGFLLRAVK